MEIDLTKLARGPFRAEQLKSGDPYELTNGHPIYCPPLRALRGNARGLGGMVLGSDPGNRFVGIDLGFSPDPWTLRAPDVSVCEPREDRADGEPDESIWDHNPPRLAIEYDDGLRPARDVEAKVTELLAHGTRSLWLVRLVSPQRVDVYEPGKAVRTVLPGAELEAEGVLAARIPVEALYDREAAHAAVLRNLLARRGVQTVEELYRREAEIGHRQGRLIGARRGLSRVLGRREIEVSSEQRALIDACDDEARLALWLERAVVASSADEVFAPESS